MFCGGRGTSGAGSGCERMQAPLPTGRIGRALDAMNFLSADVRNAFGPYINLYLVAGRHWSPLDVGLIMTASGVLGIAAQTPIGAGVDVTRAKRGAIVSTMAVMAACALVIYFEPFFWPMLFATSLLALAGDVFVPAVAALTLGLYPKRDLAWRLARNSAFDHAGNIAIAVVAGAIAFYAAQRSVFLLVPFFAALTGLATSSIPAAAIDHARARDLTAKDEAPADYGVLLRKPPLMILAFSAALFQFANAPLLPFVGQTFALTYPQDATTLMSVCIVLAQGVMLPIAILAGRTADSWGRRPLFLIAFVALPLRCAMYAMSSNLYWLIGIELLDGIAAGIFAALMPLIIADIMNGTGRYNFAYGAVATAQGLGAALSAAFAGAVLTRFGYTIVYLTLGVFAFAALGVFALAMPETKPSSPEAA